MAYSAISKPFCRNARKSLWPLYVGESHVHFGAHSENPAHYRSNLAALFPIWDHLFGTFVDPETVSPKDLVFGIGETVPSLRLAIGV